MTGQLPGGTRLVQTEIAKRLQVSTTPVREALRDLATEGLIHLSAHRGATVAQLDVAEVREVYALRVILEVEALRRAARRVTPAEIAAATAIQDRMESEQDPTLWAILNRQFHEYVVATARSPRLVALVESLRQTASPYVATALRTRPRPLDDHNRQHRVMLACLEAGDADASGRVAAEHLVATLAEYERLVDATGS